MSFPMCSERAKELYQAEERSPPVCTSISNITSGDVSNTLHRRPCKGQRTPHGLLRFDNKRALAMSDALHQAQFCKYCLKTSARANNKVQSNSALRLYAPFYSRHKTTMLEKTIKDANNDSAGSDPIYELRTSYSQTPNKS